MKDNQIWNLSYQHILFFLMVVECKTMTEAARRLNVTQPLLSQKIAQMEEIFRAKLFRREKKRLILTEAGERAYARLSVLRRELMDTAMEAQHTAEGERVVLNVGWANSGAIQTVAHCTRAMEAQYPELQMNVQLLPLTQLYEGLRDGTLDFIIVPYDYVDEPDFNAVSIADLPMYVTMGDGHPLASKTELEWADLAPYTVFFPALRNGKVYPGVIRNIRKAYGVQLDAVYSSLTDPVEICLELLLRDWVTITTIRFSNLNGLKHYAMPGIHCPLLLTWRRDNVARVTKYIETFRQLVRECALSDSNK